MNSSYKTSTERNAILRALQAPPARGYFVWGKKNEDESPATVQELHAGIAAFRASGSGWQTRMNEALKDWLKSHPQASSPV